MLKLPRILEDLIDVTPPVGGAAVTSDFIPNFTIQQQEASQWCWAACSSSTSKFRNNTSSWNQCTIVNQAFGVTNCCISPKSGACNKPNTLNQGLNIVGLFGGFNQGSLPLNVLQPEISNRHPMFIYLGEDGKVGHFVAITGYSTDSNGKTKYRVQDPDGSKISDVAEADLKNGNYENRGPMTYYFFTI